MVLAELHSAYSESVSLARQRMPRSLFIVSQDHRGALPAGTHGLSWAGQLRKENAQRALWPLCFIESTWHSLHAEARMAEGRGPQGRAEILGMVSLSGNGNELRGLRAKVRRGASYHAKGCFQGYQHVMLSSIVRLGPFPWHKTVLPPSRRSVPCIIAEKALKMPHFSKTGSRNMAEICAINFSYPTSYSTSIQLGEGSIGTPSARSNGSRPRT